jgi:hypothetical protein
MLLAEISTESIYCSEYLSRSVTISLSECTHGVSGIPSVNAGMQSSNAVLRRGDEVACVPRHPDDVAYTTLGFDELSDL